MSTLKTTITWIDAAGEDQGRLVAVTYNVTKGYLPTRIDPGADDEVEIERIDTIEPFGECGFDADLWMEDDGLKYECWEDWRDRLIDDAEYRAEHRAEMLREEKL